MITATFNGIGWWRVLSDFKVRCEGMTKWEKRVEIDG